MTDAVCKKCKQPCDAGCATCKKGYLLHLGCMKPGDRLAVQFRRWRTTEEAHDWAEAFQFIALGILNLAVVSTDGFSGFADWGFVAVVLFFCGAPAAAFIVSALDERRNRQ
jgi:hypothetical protein